MRNGLLLSSFIHVAFEVRQNRGIDLHFFVFELIVINHVGQPFVGGYS